MKKNHYGLVATRRRAPVQLKLLRIMKLTFAFLFLCCMHVSAGVVSQTRITLKLDKVDLKEALAAIEQKSSYRFLYNEALVRSEGEVTLNANNEEVVSVLNKILNGRPITYQVLENYLVVLKNAGAIGTAQPPDITITGRVTGPTGEPMANVSVSVRGTTIGTTTNAQGNFTISVPDENAVLVFSYVGFTTQEIPVRGETAITVTMAASDRSLDQVVVVGYGTARRRDLTGSVATVSGAEIAKQPVLTPTQAIQGRVAGVQIITSGAPNALPTVRIRGIGTTLGGQDPLYVVDGVITEDIRNINNADITSMEILKDASATAIYGMRAANGVIIITTKKGRPGKLVVNYDGLLGVREATNLVDMAGPNQYAGYLNEASVYYGTGDSLIPSARLTGTHTDWFDAILRRGFLQNHNVSMSGGSERINYFLSAGYTSEEGILQTNKFNRFTVRSNNEYKLTNKLKLSSLVSFSRFDLRDVDYGAFNNAYRAAPYVPSKVGNLYGNTSAAGNVANPLLSLEKVHNQGVGNRVQGTFGLEFKPISWITFRSSMGIDLDFYKKTEYLYKFLSDANTFTEAGGNQQRGNSRLNITDNTANKWVWDNTVQFVKSYDDHNLNFLVGMTAEQYKFSSITGGRFDVPENRDQWYLNAGSLNGAISNETGDKWARNSYLSRLNYNFNEKYYLTATFRADGTSRFSEDNRWGYFPSVGAAWLITREDFMDDQKIFDQLKLRGSWGRVGNDKIPTSLYYTLARLNVPYYFNGQEYLGISFPDVTDRNVKWEVTKEIDLGLDFAVLNNRLSGELDWYKKETSDALVYVVIPGILGDPDSRYVTNAATFENKGFEVTLNWRDNINKDLSYRIGANVGFNKNRITGLNGGQALFAGNIGGQGFITLTDNNQTIGSFYILEVEGILQTEAEVAASGQSGAKVGDLNYRDVSGPAGKADGVIDSYDRTFQGSYQPKATFGINGGLEYKAFDLSFNGYGTAGGKIYNGKRAIRGADPRDNIEAEIAKNRWTPNNTNTSHPRATLNQMPASTYFLEKGNFFRLNNLTIGYTLPQSLLSRVRINSFRIYFTTQNLFTFTPYSGFTPELQTSEILEAGIESNSYPTTRTFAFGLNVGF